MSMLGQIFERKQEEVANRKLRVPLSELKAQIWDTPTPRGFRHALQNSDKPVALIAEVKQASPSRGVIRENFDAKEVAMAYERAGAHCLSVLTDEPGFKGSLENLKIAKEATSLPCLRKDFVADPYQIYEARAWGADAVLLILAGLHPSQFEELFELIHHLGMDALVEIYTNIGADLALAIGAKVVGVNNRDLATFETDLSVSERVLPLLPKDAVRVSESGIENSADVARVQAAGAQAVLIGTSFCAAPDIESKVREVMGWPAA